MPKLLILNETNGQLKPLAVELSPGYAGCSVNATVHLRVQYRRCGKAGCGECPHGPYGFIAWRAGEKMIQRYLGKLPKEYGPAKNAGNLIPHAAARHVRSRPPAPSIGDFQNKMPSTPFRGKFLCHTKRRATHA